MSLSWKKICRCGAPLNFSCEDVKTGQPAEGADYWCSSGDDERAPHDFGVVVYQGKDPKLYGPERLS